MRKNKWISLIVVVLLIVSTFAVFSFGDGSLAAKVLNQDVNKVYATDGVADDELNLDMNFVSGSAGKTAEELKAEKEAENAGDDFIVTAIGNNINSSTKEASDSEETAGFDVVPETKPEDPADMEDIPYDIADPEGFESGEVEYADNQILIKFKKSFDGKVDKELKEAGVGKLEPMFTTETGDWFLAYLLKESDVNETMEAVRALKSVVVAEYNFVSEPASIDTDPLSDAVTENELVGQQWVLKSCGIQASWEYLEENGINPGGSSSVTVAVIDTGVDYTHKDLIHNIWTNVDEIPDNNVDDDHNGYVDDYYGIDMTLRRGSGMDDHGHGTHVAGIIAAENNNIGVVGIAYNTKVMPVKAGDASGHFLDNTIATAIMYAYNEGADVINMSFGGGTSSVAVKDALEIAYSRCVLVAAAGNGGMPNDPVMPKYPNGHPNYPGNYKFVIGVMSSDREDIEASFTNWDVMANNVNEYEVYAPGVNILSTLPGDRYASLSGTSMASPVVAAQAALLKSIYNDPDTFPTKFIYGQICGTGDNTINCFDKKDHGEYHIHQRRVNFNKSLTDLPRPEISLSDYTVFDTVGFTNDTEGISAGAEVVNNGDGIIDSGEIIALGFTLRNRWSVGKDTIVSIDATSDLGVENPYVTILNNNIDYGMVGTYSEQDAGRIITDDMWTGWEKPFYIKIDDNCPNDYTISINVQIKSKNGLNEEDTTTYNSINTVEITVRNGVILPNKITENMTLTADNYYIIPTSTIIMENATVTVEPGTKIQFWTNDPQDPYAESTNVFLKVQGQLLCKGTENAPVELFPSDLKGDYRLEIFKSVKGFISMEYTNVTNPYLYIDYARNCVFDQTYEKRTLRYIRGNGWWPSPAKISIQRASECVYYKLGAFVDSGGGCRVGGLCERCCFIDSNISFNNQDETEYQLKATLVNCLLYGNNARGDGEGSGWQSYYSATDNLIKTIANDRMMYELETDKYYISVRSADEYLNIVKNAVECNLVFSNLAKIMGGELAGINSAEEFLYIADTFASDNDTVIGCGLHRGEYDSVFNYDETEVPRGIPVEKGELYYGVLKKGVVSFTESHERMYKGRYLLEIPGNGLATNIELDKYVYNLETGDTAEIYATIVPSCVSQSDLIYTSQDESVAIVDENGNITAVSPGTTEIRVYSQDMAIYNYVTVNVTECVPLLALDVLEDEMWINVGDSKAIKPVYTPNNTTRKRVTYSSSDENIASVSSKGIVTAQSVGDAMITLTGDNGLTVSVTVHGIIPAESITFSRDNYETSIMRTDDSTVTDPLILPESATDKTLVWESTDESVCAVESGQLIKRSTGIATLRATVAHTDLSDEITVLVTDTDVDPVAVKTIKTDGTYIYAITEQGYIYIWGREYKHPTKMPYCNVKDAYLNNRNSEVFILDKTGCLKKYSWSIDSPVQDVEFGSLSNIKALSSQNRADGCYYAIEESGAVWAWGGNDDGQLGDGSLVSRSVPVQMNITNPIVDVTYHNLMALLLDNQGNTYMCGGTYKNKTPVFIMDCIDEIYSSDQYLHMVRKGDSKNYTIDNYGGIYSDDLLVDNEHYISSGSYYIDNGDIFVKGYNTSGCLGIGTESYAGDYVIVSGINGVKSAVFYNTKSSFFITETGELYATGYNADGELGLGSTNNVNTPKLVEFFSKDYSEEELSMVGSSIDGGVLTSEGAIEIIFDMALEPYDDYSMIRLKSENGNVVSIDKRLDMNKLIISPKAELENGTLYTLTIPQTAMVSCVGGAMQEEIILSFTYSKTPGDVNSGDTGVNTDPGTGSGEMELDEDEVHSTVVDEEKMAQRDTITANTLQAAWEEYCGMNINANFYSNVILNRINDDDVSGWLRISAPGSDEYMAIYLGGNYWGTTNEDLIDMQILDFDDNQNLVDIDAAGYLTEPPADTFPFVTKAYLMVNGEQASTVGNEEVTFVVNFNRAMDTSIPLDVKFGSSYPYADYTISGEYVTDTEWQGTVTLNTLIENGYQYFSISNGKAAGTSMKLYKDWGRFPFMIDTSSAQSLLMQGNATEEGIYLTWTQDDFETLAGYNVYRSTAEDGYYARVNKTVIPADTKELLDDTVEPGVKYYYNFTVVQSDMTESEPSGKVQVTSLDTMAPNIYHTPVTTAYKGNNLVISATIIDNVGIQNATLYYRIAGTEEWKFRTMDKDNDKYSAVVNSSYLTDDGLEYYIEAFDGITYTYKGSAEEPFFVMVQEAFSYSDLGDVDGNGIIELKDAMMLLMAVNDRLNLTEDQFMRADLDGNGELSAMEALRIICYINGTISSLI